MNETSATSPVWGILAGIIVIIALVGGGIYLIGDQSVRHAQAVASAEHARAAAEAARSYAQVEIARAHEAGSTERMQVFALTLRSFTADNTAALILLAVGVLILAVLQLVQALTRPRGDA